MFTLHTVIEDVCSKEVSLSTQKLGLLLIYFHAFLTINAVSNRKMG